MTMRRLIAAAAVTLLLAACGGGGSGGSSAPVAGNQTGKVTMTMSDGPIDGYSKVVMVVNEIRLLSSGGQDVIVLDEPKEIDFLALSNFSEVLIKREVVAGTYSKIRLILDSLTLEKTDANGNVIQSDPVDMHGLQKVDINPQGTFTVRGGEEIIINVDLNLDRSIHIVSAGNSGNIHFRPVVFATISTQPAFDHLFRVEGTIDSINSAASTLNVCDIRRVSDDGARGPNPQDVCVFTDPDGDTSYFDSESKPLSNGFGGLAVNDSVVMYGKFDPDAATDTFVPAAIALGSRDTFARERGISGEFVPDPNDATAPGTMNLDEVNSICLLAPAERVVGVASQTAVFSEDDDGNATRIDRTAIARCHATEAEGSVIDAATPGEFLRSFVVLQGAAVVAEEELVGSLASASGGAAGEYTLTPTPPASGDQCVLIDANTKITQIETVNGTSTVTQLDTPPLGVEVSVIGVRNANNCLAASEVVREL
jgi:hypothetical protein